MNYKKEFSTRQLFRKNAYLSSQGMVVLKITKNDKQVIDPRVIAIESKKHGDISTVVNELANTKCITFNLIKDIMKHDNYIYGKEIFDIAISINNLTGWKKWLITKLM